MLSVLDAKCRKIGLYAECHYAECRYVECCGGLETPNCTSLSSQPSSQILDKGGCDPEWQSMILLYYYKKIYWTGPWQIVAKSDQVKNTKNQFVI